MRTCQVENCPNVAVARGLCMKHYKQISRNGVLRQDNAVCAHEGCSDKIHGRGYCRKHYNQLYRKQKAESIKGGALQVACDAASK